MLSNPWQQRAVVRALKIFSLFSKTWKIFWIERKTFLKIRILSQPRATLFILEKANIYIYIHTQEKEKRKNYIQGYLSFPTFSFLLPKNTTPPFSFSRLSSARRVTFSPRLDNSCPGGDRSRAIHRAIHPWLASVERVEAAARSGIAHCSRSRGHVSPPID